MKLTNLLFLFALFSIPALGDPAPVIGIFGDSHGKGDAVAEVLAQMREKGVTHVIGMGDFVSFKFPENPNEFDLREGSRQLNAILNLITPMSGVPRERVWLMPGNWEHESIYDPREMNEIIRRYGNLVFENYDSHGFIEIGKRTIMVSHFPVYPVPDRLLPPPEYQKAAVKMTLEGKPGNVRYVKHDANQAFIMETITRGIHPPPFVELAIYAHTHIGGHFVDQTSGKLVINPGVLDSRTKAPSEPRGYAIYHMDQGKVEFFDYEYERLIRTASVSPSHLDRKVSCRGFL